MSAYSEDEIIVTSARQDGVERFNIRNLEDKNLHKHSSLQEYYNSIGDDLFNYKIFIITRNPYDRIVSFYFSPHRGTVRYERDDFLKFVKKVTPIENYISINNNFQNGRLLPMIELLRFDKLNEDFETLVNALGLQGIKLPHRNKSNHEHYQKYYDEETIELVYKMNEYEINLFNYNFYIL